MIGYAYYSAYMHISGLLRHTLDFYELGFGRISDLDMLGEAKKVDDLGFDNFIFFLI